VDPGGPEATMSVLVVLLVGRILGKNAAIDDCSFQKTTTDAEPYYFTLTAAELRTRGLDSRGDGRASYWQEANHQLVEWERDPKFSETPC